MTTERAKRSRLIGVGLLLAFALLGFVGIVSYSMTNRQVANTALVEHTHTVIETIEMLSTKLAQAQATARGYLLIGDASDISAADSVGRAIHVTQDQLATLTRDNWRQQERLDRLAPLIQLFLRNMVRTVRNSDATMARISPILGELLDEERRLLVLRDDAMGAGIARNRIIQLSSTVAGFALVTLALVGLRREIRRRLEADLALRTLNDELERRVQLRTAELEASNLALESFSYSVAHDLRTPLRGLSGFSEILLDDYEDKLDPDGVDALREIRDNSLKMSVLIDALLSLSRVTRSAMKSGEVDLAAMARSVVGTLQAAEPRPEFQLIVADDLHANLDPQLARVLIEHLIGNAWKFTSKIAAGRVEFGVRDATFFVRDNGAGFDMAHATKLFVPFHRLHTVAEFPGTGIGLSTAQRIVGRFGGRIWAEGQIDKGATFYFTLSEEATS